jgi:hypothetical protein
MPVSYQDRRLADLVLVHVEHLLLASGDCFGAYTFCLQAQGWSLASQFGGASAAGPRAPSQQAATVPVMPTLPPKFNEPQQQPPSEVAARPSQVPAPGLGNFNAEQKWVVWVV